jgi:hypothetical protein
MKNFKLFLLIIPILLLSACSTNKENFSQTSNLPISSDDQVEDIVEIKDVDEMNRDVNINAREETNKGWLVFYDKEIDIKDTDLKLNTYYLVKKGDISENFTFSQFNDNKSAIKLLELEITNECNFISPKNKYFEEVKGICLDTITGYPTGLFGDRITVSGTMDNDKLFVADLELNSFFSVEQW